MVEPRIRDAYAWVFNDVFLDLPAGSFETVLAHLLTVHGAFVAFMLTAFWIAACGMSWLTVYVASTLFPSTR